MGYRKNKDLVTSMKKSHLIEFSSQILSLGLPLVLFGVIVGFYFGAYDFIHLKKTIAYLGICILLFIWLIKIGLEKKIQFYPSDLLWLAPFLIFLASGVLSFLLAPYPIHSIEPLLRRFLFIGVAFLIIFELRTVQDRLRLWKYVLVGGIVALLYGTLQHFDWRFFYGVPGIDPFIWRQLFIPHRISSLFGNANFYGNFLVMVFPLFFLWVFLEERSLKPILLSAGVAIPGILSLDKLTLGLFGGVPNNPGILLVILSVAILFALGFAFKKKGPRKGLILFLFGLFILNVYSCGSKASWVGLCIVVFGLVWFLMRFFFRSKKQTQRLKIGLLAVLLFFSLLVSYFLFGSKNVSSLFRIYTWVATWEMIQTRPVLGAGLGSFEALYPAYRRPEVLLLEEKSTKVTSHAENEYLELWQNEGLFGLGLFLWLCFVALYGGYKKMQEFRLPRPPPFREAPRFWESLGSFCALLGLLAHSFFDISFRQVSSNVFGYVLLGILISNSREPGFSLNLKKKPRSNLWVLASLAVLVGFASAWFKLRVLPKTLMWEGATPIMQYALSALFIGGMVFLLTFLIENMGRRKKEPFLAEKLKTRKVYKYFPNKVVLGLVMTLLVVLIFKIRNQFMANLHHRWGFDFARAGILSKSPDNLEKLESAPLIVKSIYEKEGGLWITTTKPMPLIRSCCKPPIMREVSWLVRLTLPQKRVWNI